MPGKPRSSGGRKATKTQSKLTEFIIVDKYELTYRNREDITNLPPGVLVVGSKNVLSNVSERLQIRKGYALDGDISTVAAAISSSFDWQTRGNDEKHLRAGFLTDAGNDGKLQYRYEASDGTVTWRDLLIGLSSVAFNFTTFWTTSESLREALFVNGSSQIQSWNGAVTEIASATASTLTKTGTQSWLDAGFYAQSLVTVGGTTTRFDITNPVGTTYRYTFDGTGTDPLISATTVSIGSYILIGAQNFNAANNGLFVVTGTGTNYFDVTNASGVAENDKTIGSGYIYKDFRNVIINNSVAYGYTGGVDTTTLTGVTPSAAGIVAGSVTHQAVTVRTNATFTSGPPATFTNGLIRVLNNQIFLASLTAPNVYISKVNDYTSYASSTPRQTGEGAMLILDDNIVGMEPQEIYMYVSAGRDIWYTVNFELQTSTVGVTYEQVNAQTLKFGQQQGARSQAAISHMKNNVITITNETTVDTLGRVKGIIHTPQLTNISDSIKLDMDRYDWTDCSIYYHRYNIYVAVPKEGLVLVYSLITNSWEAPQELPISRFYTVDGELYGHSYATSESYKLFTGYADRVYPGFLGYPINMIMKFSYQNYGSRFAYKSAKELYIEGYINENTNVTTTITYEIDGCATVKTFTIRGDNRNIVCIPPVQGAFGESSLGKVKLGGDGPHTANDLPPKFRVIPTFNNTDFFEVSISFSVLGTNNRFELLAFGLNATPSTQEPVKIKE